jgi:flavodoxin
MKTLVVYFSRDGHTKKIAEQIAEKLNADIEAIKESTNRKGIIGWLKSGAESARGKVPEINTLSNDVESYDLVVVGPLYGREP